MKTTYIAASFTFEAGHKIGDTITMAHAARLMVENEPHDRILLSLNPRHPLNFVFDAFVKDHDVTLLWDDWTPSQEHCYHEFDIRRKQRVVHGHPFQTYKELYRRLDGGARQTALCGFEKGLGKKNIFEYFFFGQESSPETCKGGASFCCESFGNTWMPDAPPMSVLIAPHAVCQGNAVFTIAFWRSVIAELLANDIAVTVLTPHTNLFPSNANLQIKFFPNNFPRLFEEVRRQQLVLCGNTGIGWIAGAEGVPLMAGEPPHFWYMDYRYRLAGVQSVVDIFEEPNAQIVASKVLKFLRRNGSLSEFQELVSSVAGAESLTQLHTTLLDLAKDRTPKTYGEIGSRLGHSAAAVSFACKKTRLSCFDMPSDTWGGRRDSAAALEKTLLHFAPGRSEITIADSLTERAREQVRAAGPFSMFLIDGNHSSEGCRFDFETILPAMESGGTIIIDDLIHHPELNILFDQLIERHRNRISAVEKRMVLTNDERNAGILLRGVGIITLQ